MKKTTITKILALVFSAMMLISLAACIGDETETTPTDTKGTEATEQATKEQATKEETTKEETTAEATTEITETESETETETQVPACVHNYEVNEEDVYCCTECGHVPECGGIHELINDDPDGHYSPECEFCGAEEGRQNAHTFSVEGEYKCTECGYIPECGGVHTYTYDENGHAINECEECGAEAVDSVPHVYADVVENGVHTAKCICDYTKATEISEAVEIYHNAQVAVNMGIAGYQASMDKAIMSDEIEFVRFDNLIFTDAKAANWPWVRLNLINDANGIEGVRFLVFKYRLGADNCAPDGSASKTTYMSCFAASQDMPGKMPPATDTLNVDVKQDGEWHTIVIDLCRIGKSVIVDAETGTATIKLIQFQPMLKQWMNDPADSTIAVSAWSEESFFDIAYIAVCDEFGDLKDIIDQETFTYRVSTEDTTNYVFFTSSISDTAPTTGPNT